MVDSGHDNDIRCHHCAGPLTKTLETSEWTVSPFIRDSFSMIGSAVGGTASAFIGFNHVMPIVRKWIKGPMWLHFLVGAPPVIVLSSACAGLAGGTVPALAQLASSSYQAAVLSSQPPQAEENHKMHKSTASSLDEDCLLPELGAVMAFASFNTPPNYVFSKD
ncbi:hypothetical protein Bca101_000719 [Brassica carinata]